jgi:DNA-binding response OmpR family regulator
VNESGKIVVIDDEESVRDVVKAYLEKDGFTVFVAANGREGLTLPDVSGEEICEEVRSRSDVPIVMLTAKASEEERVGGLVAGADDYLVKPFSPRELVARVRAVLRRTRGVESPLVEVLRFDEGRLEIDTVRHAVLRDGQPVDLTPNEYKLLLALARYPGRAYSRLELVERVQGYDYEGYERTIDVHVKNLRKKIEPDSARPRYVETVTGVGYRLARL